MPDAKQALIEKIKKDMAKAHKIKISAIEFHLFMMVGLYKYAGFSVNGLKEGFGRGYEKIFKLLPWQFELNPFLAGNFVVTVNFCH